MYSTVKKICDFGKMLQEHGLNIYYDRAQIGSMTPIGNHVELLMYRSAFTYRLEYIDMDKIYASMNGNYMKLMDLLHINTLTNPKQETFTMTKIEKFADNLLNYLKDKSYYVTYDGVEVLGAGVITSNTISNEIVIRTKNGLISFNDSEKQCIEKLKIAKSLQVDINTLF